MSNLVGWLVTLNSSGVGSTYAGGRLYSSAGFSPRTQIEQMVAVSPLRHVRFAPNSGFIIICEGNHVWYGTVLPVSLIDEIQAGIEEGGLTLLDVFFTPNNDWVVMWQQKDGSRKYNESNYFPQEILSIINTLDLNGTTAQLLCLAFPPPTGIPNPSQTALTGNPPPAYWASCIVLCDKNLYQPYNNPPSDIISKLAELKTKNFELQSVVYSSATGWLITMANNAYWANGAFDPWLFQQIGQAVTNLTNQKTGLRLADVVIEAPIRNYTFQILTIFAKQIRSGFPSPDDTLLGQASITVQNLDIATIPSPAPATTGVAFGNFINEGFMIGLNGNPVGYNPDSSELLPTGPDPLGLPPQYAMTVGPIQISDPRASVVFSYNFVNKGRGIISDLNANEQLLIKGALQAASFAIQQFFSYIGTPAIGSITTSILSQYSTSAFTNCDGLVAADTFITSGAALMALASSQLGAAQSVSGTICGQTSEYNNVLFPDYSSGGKSPYDSSGNSGCSAPDYLITWAIEETDSECPLPYGPPVSVGKTQIRTATTPWPAGQVINNTDQTPNAVASCVFLNKLYLFWSFSNSLFRSASSDGRVWPAGVPASGPRKTNLPLAACVYENYSGRTQLYLFCTDMNTSAMYYDVCTDGTTWLGQQVVNNTDTTSNSPAACVFKPPGAQIPQLYLFWKAKDSANWIFYSSYGGSVDDNNLPVPVPNGVVWPSEGPWPAGKTISNANAFGFTTSAAPNVCVFQSSSAKAPELYLFWKSNSADQILFSVSSDGQTWANGAFINGTDTTSGPLAACVFQNQLYLFWTNASNKIYFSSSWDGQTWTPGMQINTADATPQSIAACVFRNQMSLAWKADDVSDHIFASASQNPFFMATTP